MLGPPGHNVQHGCQALGPCYFPAVSDKITNTENVHALSTRGKVFDYKVSHFHRVIPGFICQGGDFTCHDGIGSKSIQGEKFDDKNFILKHTDPEILPMKMLDPTQMDPKFSCVQTKTEWLDRGHMVLAQHGGQACWGCCGALGPERASAGRNVGNC